MGLSGSKEILGSLPSFEVFGHQSDMDQ